jgi:thiamine-phosphate pyrophosphorylase
MICMVTDRHRLSDGPDALEQLVALVTSAARAGTDLIQIRERDLDAADLLALARRCVAAVAGTGARVVVNDRADVVVAAAAHGVHLRGDSIDAAMVRSLLPEGAIVGRSVHSAEEAGAVSRAGGVDYLVFGTLFPTISKPPGHPLAPLEALSQACRASAVPVVGIGGITLGNASDVARAGAAGVAAVGLFVPPRGTPRDTHLHTTMAGLRRAFDTCRAVS